MSRFFLSLTYLLTLLIAPTFASESAGKIAAVDGQAWVFSGHEKRSAAIGMAIYSGDLLVTEKKTFMQVLFSDGTRVNLIGESHLEVKEVLSNESLGVAHIDLKSEKGIYQFFSGKIGDIAPSQFRLQTTNAIIGIQGSEGFINDQGKQGVSVAGENINAVFNGSESEVAKLLEEANNPKNFDEFIKAIQLIASTKNVLPIVDASGQLKMIFTEESEDGETTYVSINQYGELGTRTMRGDTGQIAFSYAKVVTGKSLDTSMFKPGKLSKNQNEIQTFNLQAKKAYANLASKAQSLVKKIKSGNKKDDLRADVNAFIYAFSKSSSDVEILQVELQQKVLEKAPLTSQGELLGKSLKAKKNRITKATEKILNYISNSASDVSEAIESIKSINAEVRKENESAWQDVFNQQVEAIKSEEGDPSTTDKVDTSKSSEPSSDTTPSSSTQNPVVENYTTQLQQEAQNRTISDSGATKTSRERLEDSLSDGRALFKGRASVTNDQGVHFGDYYYYKDPVQGKSVLGGKDIAPLNLQSLSSREGGENNEAPDPGDLFAYAIFVSDDDGAVIGFNLDEPAFRGSLGSGGTSDNLYFHTISAGEGNVLQGSGGAAMNSIAGLTGRERFYSKPESDTQGGFSGNTFTGFTPPIANSEQTFTVAEIDYDEQQIMLSVMGDSRATFEQSSENQLGYIFKVGIGAVPTQTTRVHMPSQYGSNLITYIGKLNDSGIVPGSITLYHPQGLVEASSGWVFSEQVFSSGVQETAAFSNPSADNYPQSANINLQFQVKSFDPLSSTSPSNASVISTVYSSGEATTNVIPLQTGTYVFNSIAPVIRKKNAQQISSQPFVVSGSSIGLGKMTVGSSANLSLDSYAIISSSSADYVDSTSTTLRFDLLASRSEFFNLDAENFLLELQGASSENKQEVAYAVSTNFKDTSANSYVDAFTMLNGKQIVETIGNSNTYTDDTLGLFGHSFMRSNYQFSVFDPSTGELRSPIDSLILGDINIIGGVGDYSLPGLQSAFVGGIPFASPSTVDDFVGMGKYQIIPFEVGSAQAAQTQGTLGVSIKVDPALNQTKMAILGIDTSQGIVAVNGLGDLSHNMMQSISESNGSLNLLNDAPVSRFEYHTQAPFGITPVGSGASQNMIQSFFIGTNSSDSSQPDGITIASSPGIDFFQKMKEGGVDGTAFTQFAGAAAKITPNDSVTASPGLLHFAGTVSGIELDPEGGSYSPQRINRNKLVGVDNSNRLPFTLGGTEILPMPVSNVLELENGGTYFIPYGLGDTIDSQLTFEIQNGFETFTNSDNNALLKSIIFGDQSNLLSTFRYGVSLNVTTQFPNVVNHLIPWENQASSPSTTTSGNTLQAVYSMDFLSGSNGAFSQRVTDYSNHLTLAPTTSSATLFNQTGSLQDFINQFSNLTLAEVVDIPKTSGSTQTLNNVPFPDLLGDISTNDYSFALLANPIQKTTNNEFDFEVKATSRDDLNAKTALLGALVANGFTPQTTESLNSPEVFLTLSPKEGYSWADNGAPDLKNLPILVQGRYLDFFLFLEGRENSASSLSNLTMNYAPPLSSGTQFDFTTKNEILNTVIPNCIAKVSYVADVDKSNKIFSFEINGSDLEATLRELNQFTGTDIQSVNIQMAIPESTNVQTPNTSVYEQSNTEPPIGKANNIYLSTVVDAVMKPSTYVGYSDFSPVLLQAQRSVDPEPVDLLPYLSFDDASAAIQGINEIFSNDLTFSVMVDGIAASSLTNVTLPQAIAGIGSLDATGKSVGLSMLNNGVNYFKGLSGSKDFIATFLQNLQTYKPDLSDSIFSLIGSKNAQSGPFNKIVTDAQAAVATDGAKPYIVINNNHQEEMPYSLKEDTLTNIAEALNSQSTADYSLALSSTVAPPTLSEQAPLTGEFGGIVQSLLGINMLNPVVVDMNYVSLEQTGSDAVYLKGIKGDTAYVANFSDSVEPVYVSKDMFFIESIQNLAGVSFLPKGEGQMDLALLALPGLESIQDLSWGAWTTVGQPTGSNQFGGVGFFVTGPREQITTLEALNALPSANLTYSGRAFAAIVAANSEDLLDTSQPMDLLFGLGNIVINPNSSEVISMGATLYSGDISDPTSEVKLTLGTGKSTIVTDYNDLGIAMLDADLTLTMVGDSEAQGYKYNNTYYSIDPNDASISGELKGNFFNDSQTQEQAKRFGGTFQVEVDAENYTHFIYGGIGCERN